MAIVCLIELYVLLVDANETQEHWEEKQFVKLDRANGIKEAVFQEVDNHDI